MAVPSATPISPSGPTRRMLSPRLSTPAARKATAGSLGLPSPIRTGKATPRTGRNTKLDSMRIWSTWPAGCSNEGPIHQPMNCGPRVTRKSPIMSVRDRATFDHFRKISRRSGIFPSVFSLVAIGETTAAMDPMKSIR